MTNHKISYLSKHAELLPPNKPLVVDKLTYFYNSKSFHLTVQLACLKGKRSRSPLSAPSLLSALYSVSTLRSPPRLYSPFSIIPPVYCGRSTIRRFAPGPEIAPASVPAFAPMAPKNIDFFQEFMRIFIEKAQAPSPLVAPTPDVEVKDNTDRSLKLRNPHLYYGNLYMEYYYFCQQGKDHFEFTGLLGYKRVIFTATFLKNRILNW